MRTPLPELHGLVLTGGRSTRMGRDKAEIAYGALPQWRAVADLMRDACLRTWWSCTERQRDAWGIGEAAILDREAGFGPIGGLHAAFRRGDGVAWLVLGCDYPNLRARDVAQLVAARSVEASAIAFADPASDAMEPLLSVWEPPAQAELLRLFAAGERSPRRVLQAVGARRVAPRDVRVLMDRDAESPGPT